MTQCPYDRSHVIAKHRLASHLFKCRRQNPRDQFKRCPFNSSHDIPIADFSKHVKTCKDRTKAESFNNIVSEPEQDERVLYQPEVNPTEENWDEEPGVTRSYLDEKDNINIGKMVSRLPPSGMSKSERKAFYRAESRRLEEMSEKKLTK